MATGRLQARLSSVSSTYKQTIPLIHRLQNFAASVGQGDDARVELASEIHHRLKEIETEMELLRVEIEPLESMNGNRRTDEARESEREQTVLMMKRLDEDLKTSVLDHLLANCWMSNFCPCPVRDHSFERLSYKRREMQKRPNRKSGSSFSPESQRTTQRGGKRHRN